MIKISRQDIIKIREDFIKNINIAENAQILENLRIKFMGRKSPLNKILKSLKELSLEERKEIGAFANQVRQEIDRQFLKKLAQVERTEDEQNDWIDVTLPGKKQQIGHIHILSQTQREIENIFSSMGFEIADGPDIEDEWHNFSALNMPADHPARDMQDTFWLKQKIKNKKQKTEFRLLPRTQTSNIQIRYMETHKPPIRIIVPGRVFRNEATDARHEHTFYQFEALVVDKDITVANFKDIARKFFSAFFQQQVEIRLRPSYFPFTEPSFEFDISCTVCAGKGCPACKYSGYLEIGGAGMVNQRVFEAVGYKKGEYQGFAWGFGINRLAMMKYKIEDIRLFMSGDLRFIKQF